MEPGPQPIEALLSARSVALVGASERSYVGRHLVQNLQTLGFPGAIYPVNPRYEQVLGIRCYPSIEELPEGPDAVVLAVHHAAVPDALEAAGRRGTRAAVIPGGGFIEGGVEAIQSQHLAADVAERYGMAMAGPNCMGVIAPAARFAMYIGVVTESLLPGHMAVVSQSGSVVDAMVNLGPRIGFSALVSCGNEARTTVGDYLRYFAGHAPTRAVALFVEGFRDARGFMDGAVALREAGKPLAVLQAARTEEAARAVAAHTGTMAASPEVVAGVLRSLGAIGVGDLDELIEVCELLGHGRMPTGRRMFVVTDSGGESSLVADQAAVTGMDLPPPSEGLVERLQQRWPNYSYIRNPMDPWAVDHDVEELYREVLRQVAQEDVDVMAVAMDKVTPFAGEPEIMLGTLLADALVEAAAAGPGPLPVYFTVPSTGPAAAPIRDRLRRSRIPLLHGARAALTALGKASDWARWEARTPGPPHGDPIALDDLEGREGEVPDEHGRRVLAAYGIRLGPVGDAAAWGLAEPPVALMAGVRRDPAFGPVVLLGLGGAPGRSLGQWAARPCPPAPEDLRELPADTVVGRLLADAGAQPGAILAVVEALARLALDHPRIVQATVDPLLAGPGGVLAGRVSMSLERVT